MTNAAHGGAARGGALAVALISEVFFDTAGPERLARLLARARSLGAELALLPELAANPWSPATRTAREHDAEAPEGPRHRLLARAARDAGVALIGGVIERDPATARRHNTALAFDAAGVLVGRYAKLHLPEEPGFWETSHYQPGERPPPLLRIRGVPLGIQICSDANRPEGTHALAAMGAEVILVPRASESATYERWRLALRANALTASVYVLSVNRPRAEQDVLLGGPSIAVDPNGEVLAESADPLTIVHIDRTAVAEARKRYPGYLARPAALYAEMWTAVARGAGSIPGGRAPSTQPAPEG